MAARKRTSSNARRRFVSESEWTGASIFIFDVEGTLVDAMMPTLRCWRETLDLFGYDVSLGDIHSLAGMDGDAMLVQLLPNSSKIERNDILERQGARFREEYLPHVSALAGVQVLFEELKRHGRKVALATDCAKDELKHYLEETGSEGLVDAIACGDDISRGKPAPSVVDVALRRVKARRKPAVLVGDTPFDAKAACEAGVMPLGVLTGHFSERALREAGCRAVFRDLHALCCVFLKAAQSETQDEAAVA